MNFLCRKWTTGINLRLLFIPPSSCYVRQQGFLYQQLSWYIEYHVRLRRLTKCSLTLTINSSFWFHYNFILYLVGIWAFFKKSHIHLLSPNSSHIHLLTLSFKLGVLFSYQWQFELLRYSWMCDLPLKYDQLIRYYTVKKIYPSSLSS